MVPSGIASLYSLFVLLQVAYTLSTENRAFDAQITGHQANLEFVNIEQRRRMSKAVNHVVHRILCYIFILSSTHIVYVCANLIEYFGKFDLNPIAWVDIAVSLPGILNFIGFMIDPAVQNAIKAIKR